MSLIEFLNARLDEDERIARTAGENEYARWAYDPDDIDTNGEVVAPDAVDVQHGREGRIYRYHHTITTDSEGLTPAVEAHQAHHIARHDPARVLREVAAKRAHLKWASTYGYTDLLGYLAYPYSDHPDYRQEWA